MGINRQFFLWIWVLVIGASACSQQPTSPVSAEIALANLLTGKFVYAPGSDDAFTDQRLRIPPLGPGEWLYLQINTGSENKIYRQRVLQFVYEPSSDTVLQRAYALRDPQAFVDVSAANGLPQSKDLEEALEDGCDMVWTREPQHSEWLWRGLVDPGRCKIFSERRQTEIAIGADALVDSERLWQAERGFDLAGQQLFGSAPDEYLRLSRD